MTVAATRKAVEMKLAGPVDDEAGVIGPTDARDYCRPHSGHADIGSRRARAGRRICAIA